MAFTIVAGCNNSEEKTYPVRGIVQFPDGKLLRKGSVEFEYLDRQPPHTATGEIQPDGSLHLLDKRTGKQFENLLVFVDDGDRGDEYDYSPTAKPDRHPRTAMSTP